MGLLDKVRDALGGKSIDEAAASMEKGASQDQIASWVRMKVDESRSMASRVAHEGIWMTNCAYVLGFNGLTYNTQTRSFQPINRVNGNVRRQKLNINKLLPNLQNRLARLTKNPPKYDVRPDDGTQEAQDNARFKLEILNAKWADLRINQKRLGLTMWTQQTGHAYMGVFWDDQAGRLMHDPVSREPQYEGDIRIEVISPFEIFPDPMAKNMEECQWWIRAKVRPLAYFKTHYGEKGNEVKEEESWLLSTQFEARINSMNTRGPAGQSAQAEKNSAIELTYFERPTIFHPEGRMIVVANGVVLMDKELPVGKIPLVKFDDIVVAGKYYSECVTTHARPLQDQYNQIMRRRADWTNKLLAGKIVSPRGNQLAREALTDEQGEVIQYTANPSLPGAGEPKPLDIPMIPSYAYTEEERIDSAFNEIMGLNEVSKGTLPSASIPALGMQILTEADDTRLGTVTENHELAYAEVGCLILDYVQRYYTTPRKIKYAGDQGYVVKEVAGEQLVGSNDVIVVKGSTIPGSKTLARQDILNLASQGLIGDLADPLIRERVLRDIEFGNVAELFIDSALDKQCSKREIETIEQGGMPEILEGFNHPFMLQELNRYMKSEKWLQLSPEQKAIMDAAKEEHLRFLGELTGAQAPQLTPEEEMAAMEQGEAAAASVPPPEEQMPGGGMPAGPDSQPIGLEGGAIA